MRKENVRWEGTGHRTKDGEDQKERERERLRRDKEM